MSEPPNSALAFLAPRRAEAIGHHVALRRLHTLLQRIDPEPVLVQVLA